MLTVYKASAGSGKTFQLVAEYLKLLIRNPFNYRQILAVTFTNKATMEMKSRILEQLYLLAQNGDSPYISLLEEELSLDELQLRYKAGLALKNILHDYTRFSVSTIDSFTQRIIRAFNREMGISPHFILELDNDLILEEAVDRLLAKVDSDKQLRGWLVDFSREKIMENRSQRIESDIKALGMELFKEKFQVFFPESSGEKNTYTRENLDAFRSELEKIIHWYENELKKKGEIAVEILRENDLEENDFSGKGRGIGAFFVKLSAGEQPNRTATVLAHAENPEKWYTRTCNKGAKIHSLAETQLLPLLQEILKFAGRNELLYLSACEVKKQLRILGILTDLKEEIKLLLKEKGILQLSDSNMLLNRIIGDCDSPFIYEKIGNRFNFFMLDEFQDTSMLQWNNFKPLIANALSEGHPVLLVGDVKQSIYRWRNSDWNILATQIDNDFPQYPPDSVSLDKNWRSRKNIIDFNNAAMESLLQTFEEDLLSGLDDRQYMEKFRKVYMEYRQEPAIQMTDSSGYTEVSFIEDEDFEVNSALLLVEQVKKLQDKGLKASETAILIRKKSEGATIVETFMEAAKKEENTGYNLSVLSNESLFLYASRGVNLVVLVVELLSDREGQIQKAALVHLWLSWLRPLLVDITQGMGDMHIKNLPDSGLTDEELKTIFDSELEPKIKQVQEKVSLLSLDETIMEICNSFGLFRIRAELPYLQALIDKTAEIKLSLSNDLSNFLFWWNAKGFNTSVNVNEEVDSIRLLTIHKSKGLEFEAVLLPYFNFDSSWTGNQAPVLWCNPTVEPFNKFPLLPVKAGSRLADTIFREDYFEEKVSSLIDTLNLVYVAFTRARSVLFVNCIKSTEKKNRVQGKTINALLESSLAKMSSQKEFSDCWNNDKTLFTYGRLPEFHKTQNEMAGNFINTYHFYNFSNRIRLRLNSEGFLSEDKNKHSVRNTGKIVHDILSSVIVKGDIEKACDKLYNEGIIGFTERNDILEKLRNSMEHPEIKRWFDGSYKVLNERNLLSAGKILRPDRIMISGKNALVADYKWGEIKQNEYRGQVGQYARILKESGFNKVEGYIWYLNLEEVEKVGEWS